MKYQDTIGAVVLLRKILPTDGWYKSEPRKGRILITAMDALDALPPCDLERGTDEQDSDWEKRRDAFWSQEASWEWSETQEDAVRLCVKFYRDAAAFAPTPAVRSLLKLLQLDKD